MGISPVQLGAKNCAERVAVFIHEYPTASKVLRVAVLIFGLAMIAAAPFAAAGLAVALGVAGVLLAITASIALFAQDLLVPPHHDMRTHVFKEGACEGGRLFYENDVPILSLDSDNRHQAGKAHGYLCGEAISKLTKRFGLVLHTLARQPRAADLPRTLEAIRREIPEHFLREIEGLVEGYNKWVSEQKVAIHKKLTVDDALLFHMVPDSLHFQPGQFESRRPAPARPREAIACTAIVDRDEARNIVFARNMDWPSFGLAGAYSLVIHRKHANEQRSTVEVGLPGLIGTVTGMNDRGLTVAMNVCNGTTNEVRGMPASLYNRACLEGCSTVEQLEAFIQLESPLGPYHMTAADPNGAKSFHFYQSPQNTHVIRRWTPDVPLTTLNCRYSPRPNCPINHDRERRIEITQFFLQRPNRPLEEALALPYINNWLTTHRVLMKPQTREFGVAFDNAFAGRIPLHAVPVQRLFAQ